MFLDRPKDPSTDNSGGELVFSEQAFSSRRDPKSATNQNNTLDSAGLSALSFARVPLSQLSELPTMHRLSTRAVALLARYFRGQLSKIELSELAGAITFPRNQHAAEIYARFASDQATVADRRELTILALFPDSQRGAQLLEQKLSDPQKLTFDQRLELYSLQQSTQHPAAAAEILATLHKTLDPIQQGILPRAQVDEALIRFVRREIESNGRVLSSSEDLSSLFNLSTDEIRRSLSNPKSGLSKQQIVQRAEKKALHRQLFEHAVDLLVVNSLRDIVYIENEMHRCGAIVQLSHRQHFSQLFGIKNERIIELLRFLPNDDWSYRETHFGNVDRELNKSFLLELTRIELDRPLSQQSKPLESDSQLASQLGVLPVAVYHYLQHALTNQLFERRELLLREQNVCEPHRQSILNFATEELEAFQLGQINRLSSERDLGRIFRVSEAVVIERLTDQQNGLSPDQTHLRHYAQLMQTHRSAPAEALRRVATLFMRERITREDTALHGGDKTPSHQSGRAILEARKRGDIKIKGVAFDSFEEAACALLLERYIPGFKIEVGKSVQISQPPHRFDFLVNNTIVEYHPTLLFRTRSGLGSFESHADYAQFNRVKMSLPLEQRKLFIEETRLLLAQTYAQSRKSLLEASIEHKSTPLIVAESPAEFYWLVLRRFGGSDVPPLESFLREFRRLKKFVKAAN